MRKHILVAGFAAAALLPSLAMAQDCSQQRHNNRVAGTVVGAGLGALLGSAIAGHDDRTGGAIIGGVGGAVAGNAIGSASTDCRAYGYYDSNGVWHAEATAASNATGYYDRDGRWVAGTPNGYYDANGRWIASVGDTNASGYYDHYGRWVPVAASGYYDANGHWVAGSVSGYYDRNGRWVRGAVIGHYDTYGRWIAGRASGHYDQAHRWIADAQPGYYDSNGRWRPGRAYGYYDANGRWISTAASASGYGADVAYEHRDIWERAPMDVGGRIDWLDHRIDHAIDDGKIDRDDGHAAIHKLDLLRRENADEMRDNGGSLSAEDQTDIQAKLDRIAGSLHWRQGDYNAAD